VDDPLERFASLYDQFYRNVLRYALQHAERDSAEDVASDVFFVAWRHLADIPEPPLPWLLGVARNLLRKQAGAGRQRRLLTNRIAALTSAADLAAWDAGEHVVEREAALAALASLPARDVETLTLITWHGLSIAEAASVAGCSYGTGTLHQGDVIAAGSVSSIAVYEDMGWTTQMGVPPPS
jgi:DNA-directed RNA polymerase specialized sigma24 family protein